MAFYSKKCGMAFSLLFFFAITGCSSEAERISERSRNPPSVVESIGSRSNEIVAPTARSYTDVVTDSGVHVSRIEGVAPLSVHFDAGFDLDRKGLGEFHTYDYIWNFGDKESGHWGTSGESRNYAYGAIATHVFYKPGNFQVELTVKDGQKVIKSEVLEIEVIDPDLYYAGERTICVSNTNNFKGAPRGAAKILTDNLSDVLPRIVPGTRILLRREETWKVENLVFPSVGGAVTIGAFGEGSNPDGMGHYENAPVIEVVRGPLMDLSYKDNWRIMDLRIQDKTRWQECFDGTFEQSRILFLNLDIEGFVIGLGWTHFNDEYPLPIDQMVIENCRISESGVNCVYIGGERIALQGNEIFNAFDSHVVRVWQAYRSNICHNIISGSSMDSGSGRQALKLHGPGERVVGPEAGYVEYGVPVPGTPLLEKLTENTVISDNVFGSSGPWPVSIGPQSAQDIEEIYDIIFERNRIITDYGVHGGMDVSVALLIWANLITIRDNCFDGSSGGDDYAAIMLGENRSLLTSSYIDIYRNRIFRKDNNFGNNRYGVFIGKKTSDVMVHDNLVSFPGSTVDTAIIKGSCPNLIDVDNTRDDQPGYLDPENPNPLIRNFDFTPNSKYYKIFDR